VFYFINVMPGFLIRFMHCTRTDDRNSVISLLTD